MCLRGLFFNPYSVKRTACAFTRPHIEIAHGAQRHACQNAATAARNPRGRVIAAPASLRLVLVSLLARGHLLLEDVPGVGKTTWPNACRPGDRAL